MCRHSTSGACHSIKTLNGSNHLQTKVRTVLDRFQPGHSSAHTLPVLTSASPQLCVSLLSMCSLYFHTPPCAGPTTGRTAFPRISASSQPSSNIPLGAGLPKSFPRGTPLPSLSPTPGSPCTAGRGGYGVHHDTVPSTADSLCVHFCTHLSHPPSPLHKPSMFVC